MTADHPWGRVDDDGNVFVRTDDGERLIGQWPGGDPAEAIALYQRRFEGLAVEVDLLERRLSSGALSPEDALKSAAAVREQVAGANALGDLASLEKRLDALAPVIDKQREARKAARAQKQAETLIAKTAIVEEAEKLAPSSDWRNGADRMRALLDEWKALPRLDRATDDTLWHRFSAARTTYTKRRKAHFAELSELHDAAEKTKRKLIETAESLKDSTDWGATTLRFRDLMRDWKAAGAAPRKVEDKLWKQFRAAQDVFFTARDQANAELDAEFAKNAEVKESLLVEAESLLPIGDLETTRRAWLSIADRWEAAGKVPRERIKELEGRLRTVERAIREAGDREWARTDPQKSARADDLISKLEASITTARQKLAAAGANADKRRIKDLQDKLASHEAFLAMAQKAATEFSR
jgi:hypothetical protein